MVRAVAILLLTALPALAQEDDRSYLTAFLEDNLSGAGRVVTITGFAGALSSQATVESITIADDEGVWITLNGLTLDWSRSSLLSGQVIVNELSAREIIVARAPEQDGTATPEASGFKLPDLPVSVEIGRIAADRIVLEPAVMGQSVEGSLEASLSLGDGLGKAAFALLRSDDGPEGRITLTASYSELDGLLDINLLAREGQGGLATTVLGLPGAPAVDLSVIGSGPLDSFAAEIKLATDGKDRLSGRVTLGAGEAGERRFNTDLAGDIAPLFVPEYADFFGPDVALKVAGSRSPLGRLTLDMLDVTTRSLQISGSAVIAADGLPETLRLTGKLASPDGAAVLLPFGGEPTRVQSAAITLDFQNAAKAIWAGRFDLAGLERADFKAERFVIDGSGLIARTPEGNTVGATLTYDAVGLRPADPGLAAALGSEIRGVVRANWLEGSGVLRLPELRVTGEDFNGSADLTIEGLQNALLTSGTIELNAQDFTRFSSLAGRPLGGNGTVVIKGSASRLSGYFDLQATFEGVGLKVGIPQADRLLDGQSTIRASILRDTTGTTLRSLTVTAKSATATATGKLFSTRSALVLTGAISDLGDLGASYRGVLALDATFDGTLDAGRIVAKGVGQDLVIGQTEVDRLLAGQSVISAAVAVTGGEFTLDSVAVDTPQVTGSATGQFSDGVRKFDLKARLANVGLFVPQFPGPLTVSGTLADAGAEYLLSLKATGPGQVDANVSGSVGRSFRTADLSISGGSQAALANAFIGPRTLSGPVIFDLRLTGPVQLASLAGRVSLAGGRLTDPNLGFAFEQLDAVLDLAAGKAQVSGTGQLSTGGGVRVDGPVSLSSPYVGDLTIALEDLRLIEPDLYQTTASGLLTITGPLIGGALITGRVDLSDTELQIPSTGFGGANGLPDLAHINEPAEVRTTRGKAGLLVGDGGSGPRSGAMQGYRLGVEISAPNRVFIRGRGLDAELGGAFRLTGSTSAIVPTGGLQLIRGRLDILGKRLVLSSADLRLEGNFVPAILVSASAESDGSVSFVMIEGPANAPVVSFSSVPELPQEEVLSRLLFGRGIDTISPFQAAQLANAVAVLAGRSGEGLIGQLRQSFGLDDLDFTAAEDGTAALRAGKYIAENVYSEIELDQEGKSRINLNLDLRPGVTVKGRLGAEGETGIGIYFEKDY